MARYTSRDTEPLAKWRGMPIYLTTILAALLVVGFLGSAFLKAARSPLLEALAFHTPVASWKGWLSVLTYPFVSEVNFFTPFTIICFYWWAAGIETHLGRPPLVRLLLLLTLTPVVSDVVLSYALKMNNVLAGDYIITIGLLVAFATLYPNAEWIGWVPFKYLAFACILCGSLMFVAERAWLGVASLWLVCLASFSYLRGANDREYDDHVPFGARVRAWFRRTPKLRIVQLRRDPEEPLTRGDFEDDEPESEMDALLDKIARNGLASLSPNERARLELAREELLKKDRK
ncbi:MAG: hypothetical protein NTV08_07195 [Verrucomicrobia bacterium]|nr:hypothetical protein [Verrucomicrobiota bacterium]